MVTTFTGHSNGWNAVTEDNGSYALDDAWLTVYGGGATVNFLAGYNKVSFVPPTAGATETVLGSGGEINVVRAEVTVTGDNDLIYFDPNDDVLNLTAATAGAWSTLYASGGVVNLAGASLSVVGGGVTINAVSGDDAVSLYQTNGAADAVNGDDMTVTLNGAQAVVHGNGDAIWLSGGSASVVTLDLTAGASATVYGAGTIDLAGGAVTSVGGSVLVNFLNPGAVARLSHTQGFWDRVQGAAGQVTLSEAQALIVGGSQQVYGLPTADNAATLAQTNGDWDSVYGQIQTLYLDNAQANIFGTVDELRLNGPQAEVSVYGPDAFVDVFAANATVDVNQARVTVFGGGDRIFASPGAGSQLTVANTDGAWDAIYSNDEVISVQDAQASIVGGGNSISVFGASAVSVYATGTDFDSFSVYNGGGAVTLNDAQVANLTDSYVYFAGAANSVYQQYSEGGDVFVFAGAFGVDTISGLYAPSFGPTDKIQLSTSQFADFQAFQNAFTQQGDDAVLTLDANDKAIFKNLDVSAVTAAQVTFV